MSYVVAGYAVTVAGIGGYGSWLLLRTRRLRAHRLPDPGPGRAPRSSTQPMPAPGGGQR